MIVPAPLDLYPHACVASGREDGEFIDTGQNFIFNPNFDTNHVYLAKGYVEQMARDYLGMVSKDEVDKLKDDLARFSTEVDQMRALFDAMEVIEKKEVVA